METSDETLVTNVLRGDTEAYAVIVDRYKVPIYNLMYRYSNSSEDASDMTQEAFCKAFERLRQYKNRKRFFSWLYTLALNYARDWAKKRNSQTIALAKYNSEAALYETPSSGTMVEADEEVARLMNALDSLPVDRQEMVLLRYRHERSIKELAEIFELKESAVKMRLHRTLETLRNKLNDTENE